MSTPTSLQRLAAPLAALVVALTALTATPAQAVRDLFFEETAQAFWSVPYACADGSTVQGTLLVQSTRDYEAPDTEDADPTTRVQFLAVCPDGTSFSWAGILPSTITSADNLKSVHTVGSGTVRDNAVQRTHKVSFDVTWTAVGPLMTEVNGPGSKRMQREATATGQVTFDGDLLVNGAANHPTRPARPVHPSRHREVGPHGSATAGPTARCAAHPSKGRPATPSGGRRGETPRQCQRSIIFCMASG